VSNYNGNLLTSKLLFLKSFYLYYKGYNVGLIEEIKIQWKKRPNSAETCNKHKKLDVVKMKASLKLLHNSIKKTNKNIMTIQKSKKYVKLPIIKINNFH